jgi:hypothetical protein
VVLYDTVQRTYGRFAFVSQFHESGSTKRRLTCILVYMPVNFNAAIETAELMISQTNVLVRGD